MDTENWVMSNSQEKEALNMRSDVQSGQNPAYAEIEKTGYGWDPLGYVLAIFPQGTARNGLNLFDACVRKNPRDDVITTLHDPRSGACMGVGYRLVPLKEFLELLSAEPPRPKDLHIIVARWGEARKGHYELDTTEEAFRKYVYEEARKFVQGIFQRVPGEIWARVLETLRTEAS